MKPGAKDVQAKSKSIDPANCFPGVWVSFLVPLSPVPVASSSYLEREMAAAGPLPWVGLPLQSQPLWSPRSLERQI